jgi:threonine/homoserine/homoserine lactone efflux protein
MNPFQERNGQQPNYFKFTIAVFVGVFLALMLFCGLTVWLYVGWQQWNARANKIRRDQERAAEMQKQQAFSDAVRDMVNREANKARK